MSDTFLPSGAKSLSRSVGSRKWNRTEQFFVQNTTCGGTQGFKVSFAKSGDYLLYGFSQINPSRTPMFVGSSSVGLSAPQESDFTVNTNRCHCPHTRLMVHSPGLLRDFQCCGQLGVYMHSSLDLSVLYPAAIESPILLSASVCHEDRDENFNNQVIKNFRND